LFIDKIGLAKAGNKASDYKCPICGFWYQLKSKKSPVGNSVRDGAYHAMMEAITEDRAPSYFFLHYDYETWNVRNLLLVPHFAFPPSAIIKCPPLAPTARRAGWVGCNFDLRRIPVEARITVVANSQVTPAKEMREKFQKIKPLKEISADNRGWMLAVLNIVRRLGKTEFTNQDVYTYERDLEQLHPDNRHIRDKIRQQLQNLAKAGFLIHAGKNDYRLV
jgi:type II restriction enzyme